MKKLLVLGAGQFAHVVAWTAENAGWELGGFVVSNAYHKPGQRCAGYPVWPVSEVAEWGDLDGYAIVSAIISPARARLVAGLFRLCDSAALVHPTAWMHQGAFVMPGSFVNAGAVLDLGVAVEDHAIVNRGALLGHHVRVRACATVGPGANLCGNVTVGRQAFVGAGAVVREKVSIGEAATVGMGAVVLRDVPAGETWWGNPARRGR